MIGVVLTPSAVSGSVAHKAMTPLQKGLAYYKGKSILLISPDAVGGGFDTNSRIIAPYMAAYLGANITVTNDSPANTIAGQDAMEAATPNGLTIGMLNPGTDAEDIVTGSPGVNFNPAKVQYLGGTAAQAGPDFECNTSNPSGISSFADVVHATSPVTEVIVSTGTQTLDLDLINAAFNINAKVIGGFVETSFEVQGQEAGDGECSVLGIATPGFGPYDAAGKAKILLTTGLPNPATAFYSETLAGTPFTQAIKTYPAKTKIEKEARAALTDVSTYATGHEYNAPARTPADEVLALRAAVQSALTNVKCEDQLLAAGQPVGWVTGPRALRDYKLELSALKPLKSLIADALGV